MEKIKLVTLVTCLLFTYCLTVTGQQNTTAKKISYQKYISIRNGSGQVISKQYIVILPELIDSAIILEMINKAVFDARHHCIDTTTFAVDTNLWIMISTNEIKPAFSWDKVTPWDKYVISFDYTDRCNPENKEIHRSVYCYYNKKLMYLETKYMAEGAAFK